MARGFVSGLASARILRKFEVLRVASEVWGSKDRRNWVMRAKSVIVEGSGSGEDRRVRRFWSRDSESEENGRGV